MSKGLDADVDLTSWAGTLMQEGYGWVGRYINPGKDQPLSVAEAKHLSAMGLYMVSIWEQGRPISPDYFSVPRGFGDGAGAVAAAQRLGQPLGTPVYFAVDYDAADSDTPIIGEYFSALHSVVKQAGYCVGVYGSGLVCQHIQSIGYCSHTWLAQSRGWADYQDWLPHADIVQGPSTVLHGLDIDLDESNGSAGGWQVNNRNEERPS